VVGAVAEEYQLDTEKVRQDVLRFLSEMRAVGLIDIAQIEISEIESSQNRISPIPMGTTGDCAVESCLAEIPESAVAAGTEGPVGREGLAAAGAR
jgi:hypothetical protein